MIRCVAVFARFLALLSLGLQAWEVGSKTTARKIARTGPRSLIHDVAPPVEREPAVFSGSDSIAPTCVPSPPLPKAPEKDEESLRPADRHKKSPEVKRHSRTRLRVPKDKGPADKKKCKTKPPVNEDALPTETADGTIPLGVNEPSEKDAEGDVLVKHVQPMEDSAISSGEGVNKPPEDGEDGVLITNQYESSPVDSGGQSEDVAVPPEMIAESIFDEDADIEILEAEEMVGGLGPNLGGGTVVKESAGVTIQYNDDGTMYQVHQVSNEGGDGIPMSGVTIKYDDEGYISTMESSVNLPVVQKSQGVDVTVIYTEEETTYQEIGEVMVERPSGAYMRGASAVIVAFISYILLFFAVLELISIWG